MYTDYLMLFCMFLNVKNNKKVWNNTAVECMLYLLYLCKQKKKNEDTLKVMDRL